MYTKDFQAAVAKATRKSLMYTGLSDSRTVMFKFSQRLAGSLQSSRQGFEYEIPLQISVHYARN